jgi:hypothetical protein
VACPASVVTLIGSGSSGLGKVLTTASTMFCVQVEAEATIKEKSEVRLKKSIAKAQARGLTEQLFQ